MFIDLYNHPNFKNYDVSSLNAGIMAGSTCPIEVVHDCVEKLNTKNIVVNINLFLFKKHSTFICLFAGNVRLNGNFARYNTEYDS